MGPVNARSGGPQATRPRKQGLAQSCMVRKVELAPRVLGGRDGPLRQERFQGSSRCASSNGGGGARAVRFLTSQGVSRAAAAEDEWVDIFHQLPKTFGESL